MSGFAGFETLASATKELSSKKELSKVNREAARATCQER
jgi:hypothetical protein